MKTLDCTIIPPTFNEAENVAYFVDAVTRALKRTQLRYEILFVDDSSDETPHILEKLAQKDERIRVVHRPPQRRTGLASAFVEGFEEAQGEIICCMDADLQHPPELIPNLVEELKARPDVSMTVASRYAPGGSEGGLASRYRKFISNVSRFVTHALFPDTKKTGDPMTGFFAFRRNILRGTTLRPYGFKILVEMLVRIRHIKVVDIPLRMAKRFAGTTKATLSQGFAFLRHLRTLAKAVPGAFILSRITLTGTLRKIAVFALIALSIVCMVKLYQLSESLFSDFLLTLAFLQLGQGIFGLYLMVYAWDDPERIRADSSPEAYADATLSFTAIIPARHEAAVIGETIAAVARIDYPRHLVQTLVVLREEDNETINAANIAIAKLPPGSKVEVLLISGEPVNKPHHLNDGLAAAQGDVVCIFDAEDEPHRDIYNIVNTVMLRDNADVVQSGVQLMNFESNWYSLFNVLEYFLWFRSSLHFFAKHQLIPLGGTSVFFKRARLLEVGGWDMRCLTEDAEIGIRLSLAGATTRVIYDPRHATQEETPPTLTGFIRQRTRWIQGFMQILHKKEWRTNQPVKKKLLTLYTLGWPALQAVLLFSIPFSILAASMLKVHPLVSLVSSVPLLVLALFIITQSISLYEFTRLYEKKWRFWYPLKLAFLFIPYQFVLGISALRALGRQLTKNASWEKTDHVGAHRSNVPALSKRAVAFAYQKKRFDIS